MAKPRLWSLRARILGPTIAVVVLAIGILALVIELSASARADASIERRSDALLEGVVQQIAERRRAKESFALLLANQPGVARATEDYDKWSLGRVLAPFQSEAVVGQTRVYDRDGRELLGPGQSTGGMREESARAKGVREALAGYPSAASLAVADGLHVFGVAPITSYSGIVGAIVVGSTLDRNALAAVKTSDMVELAIYSGDRLTATTVEDRAAIRALAEARPTTDGIAPLGDQLNRLQYHVTARQFGDGGLIAALAITRDEVQASRERTLVIAVSATVAVLLLSLLGLALARSIDQPLRAVVAAAAELEQGSYAERVRPSGIRELNELSQSINQLAIRLEHQRSELHERAFYDPLTGLPNRALFLDRLDHALARSARRGTSVAVLFLDLDNFKVINDSLGHQAGDELLTAVAKRLRLSTRDEDTVARLGGDEFTVLVEDLGGQDEAIALTERIGTRMQGPFAFGGHEIVVSCSIGIAISRPEHTAAGEMLREADLAMYRAKSSGKARYAMFDHGMSISATERLELEVELRRAVERHELRVHYQPIVALESGRITEVEALVRWQHPRHGLISPARFIPIAEETGLIVPLGRWVLREACRQVSQWQRQFPMDPPIMLSVNLSARQFMDPGLVEQVAEALRETGLPAGCLKLELTESMLMGECTATIARLEALRGLGVRLAVDDFGTGYSSLAYLKRFPVDILKIDRSFVDGLGRDPEDEAIVRNIVGLARSLGLEVTGEGIETDNQRSRLRALGCERGQGYYFARPLPGSELADLLERSRYLPLDAPGVGSGAHPLTA